MTQEHTSPIDAPKFAIVTGAASGIGKAITRILLKNDFTVGALDCDQEALLNLSTELPHPERISTQLCDVGSEKSIEKAIGELGFEELFLLVCNGGPVNPVLGEITDIETSDWLRFIDTHLTGAFILARTCTPALRRGKGSIVNIASTRALMSEAGTFGYTAAKGGMVALTHALAVSLGPKVRANTILPGWIAHDHSSLSAEDHAQHPVGRVGEDRDIAQALMYLAHADFVTGESLVVDGGMTKKMIYV